MGIAARGPQQRRIVTSWVVAHLMTSQGLDDDTTMTQPPSVTLYTREGCHLCDEARRVLQEHGLVPEEIDIDTDAALREQYDQCVPVVVMDGRLRFRGRVEPVLLRRILAGQS